MSRSRRRSPVTGVSTCRSEKGDKQLWHRRFRSADGQRLRVRRESYDPLDVREKSDPLDMGKDGRIYWGWSNQWFKEKGKRK